MRPTNFGQAVLGCIDADRYRYPLSGKRKRFVEGYAYVTSPLRGG